MLRMPRMLTERSSICGARKASWNSCILCAGMEWPEDNQMRRHSKPGWIKSKPPPPWRQDIRQVSFGCADIRVCGS